MNTETLTNIYGPLLTYGDLASLLKRSEGGLRFSVSSGKDPYADVLREARKKIGRRTYFRAEVVSRLV